jgi:isopenicillin N synthase-like dioxygenase
MSHDQGAIPVLDLGRARQDDGSFSPDFIEQLRHATHHVGFFQITGYGASPGQPERAAGPYQALSSHCRSRNG